MRASFAVVGFVGVRATEGVDSQASLVLSLEMFWGGSVAAAA